MATELTRSRYSGIIWKVSRLKVKDPFSFEDSARHMRRNVSSLILPHLVSPHLLTLEPHPWKHVQARGQQLNRGGKHRKLSLLRLASEPRRPDQVASPQQPVNLPKPLLAVGILTERAHYLHLDAVRLDRVEQKLALLALVHYPSRNGDYVLLKPCFELYAERGGTNNDLEILSSFLSEIINTLVIKSRHPKKCTA